MKIFALLLILSPLSMNFYQSETAHDSWTKLTMTKIITEWKESNLIETQLLKCNTDKNCSSEKNEPMLIWLFCCFIIVMTSPRRKITQGSLNLKDPA